MINNDYPLTGNGVLQGIVGTVSTGGYAPYSSGFQQLTYSNFCSGNTHTWKCDHAVACQCGKAQRELPKCGSCGK